MRLRLAVPVVFAWLTQELLADQFTNPSNSKADLAEQYTLGQTVQLRWDTSLNSITLLVNHWGSEVVGSLLSDAANPGAYTWTIGQNDNIDDAAIQKSPNFVLVISDPSGSTTTGNGFVNGQLSSRAFIIKSNSTSAAKSSSSSAAQSSTVTSSSLASTLSTATIASASSSGSSTSSASSASSSSAQAAAGGTASSSGLSTGAKAGIGAGAGIGALILIAAGAACAMAAMKKRRRNSQDPGMVQHNLPPTAPVNPSGLYEFEAKHKPVPAPVYRSEPVVTEMDGMQSKDGNRMVSHVHELEGGRNGLGHNGR